MLKVVTQPAVEPVSLAEVKLRLKVDLPDDDDVVAGFARAARELCEAEISRAFIATGFRLTLDCFPGMEVDPRRPGWTLERPSPGPLLAIRIPRSPVSAVTSIRYLNTDNVLVTLDPSLYLYETGDDVRIYPVRGRTWPATTFLPGSVSIDFTAGYGESPDAVPATVKSAIYLTASSLYYNRGEDTTELSPTVRLLLAAEDWGAYG